MRIRQPVTRTSARPGAASRGHWGVGWPGEGAGAAERRHLLAIYDMLLCYSPAFIPFVAVGFLKVGWLTGPLRQCRTVLDVLPGCGCTGRPGSAAPSPHPSCVGESGEGVAASMANTREVRAGRDKNIQLFAVLTF